MDMTHSSISHAVRRIWVNHRHMWMSHGPCVSLVMEMRHSSSMTLSHAVRVMCYESWVMAYWVTVMCHESWVIAYRVRVMAYWVMSHYILGHASLSWVTAYWVMSHGILSHDPWFIYLHIQIHTCSCTRSLTYAYIHDPYARNHDIMSRESRHPESFPPSN